jgi:hypothetical protein
VHLVDPRVDGSDRASGRRTLNAPRLVRGSFVCMEASDSAYRYAERLDTLNIKYFNIVNLVSPGAEIA